MNTRVSLVILAFAVFLCACVIDGVPLPDETPEHNSGDTGDMSDIPAAEGVYATLASGVTVVFGVPGSAPANATVVALSGSIQAQTASTTDGSFNLALSGATGNTIDVRIIVGSAQVGHASLSVPRAESQVSPDGAAASTSTPATPKPTTSSTRLNATTVQLAFPAESFPQDASVAIANLDRGTTATASAGADGGLVTDVIADSGDTLYIVTISAQSASAPYVLTAPQ